MTRRALKVADPSRARIANTPRQCAKSLKPILGVNLARCLADHTSKSRTKEIDDDQGDDKNSGTNMTAKFKEQMKQKRINDAKWLAERRVEETAAGKEPFDLDAFFATYRTVERRSTRPRPEQLRDWEMRYYSIEKARSIEEFARHVEMVDVYEGGDMKYDYVDDLASYPFVAAHHIAPSRTDS